MPYEQNSCAYTATQLLRTIDNNIEIDASTYTAQKQTVNSSRRVFNMDNDKDIQELENYLSSNPFSAVYGMDTALTQHQALNLQEAPHHAMTAIRNPYSGKFNLVQNNSYSTGFAGAGSVQIQEYDVAMEKLKHYKIYIKRRSELAMLDFKKFSGKVGQARKDYGVNIDSVITKNKEIDDADLDGEKVMMNLDKGQYFMMNEVGSRIWELIEGNTPIVNIIEALTNEYDVDEETCENTVMEFLGRLKDADLIKVV